MKYKKGKWNHQALEDILTDEQMLMLNAWIRMEGLIFDEYDDSLLRGVRVWARDPETGEGWEMDFVRRKEEE